MLPSRGLSRVHAASVVRQCSSNPSKATRSLPFSRQLSSSTLSRSPTTTTSLLSQRTIRPAIASAGFATPGACVGVFANRSGASRNLSLWPSSIFGYGSKPKQPADSSKPGDDVVDTAPTTASIPEQTPQAPLEPPVPEPAPTIPDATPTSDLNLDGLSILDMPENIGFLKNMGLDFGWGPTSMCEYLLEHVYVYTGLPWWASIMVIATAFRAALFIPTLHANAHSARIQALHKTPEFQAALALQKQALASSDSAALLTARTKQKKLMNQAGAKISMTLIPFALFPISIGMFRLLRNMASVPVPSLETGGLAWFIDLSVHDPLYILPLANVALSVVTFRAMSQTAAASNPAMASMQSLFQYVLPPLVFVTTAWLPSALQFFFLNLTVGTLAQTFASQNPAIRRAFDMPPLPAPGQGASLSSMGEYQPPKPRGGMDGFRDNVDTLSTKASEYMGSDPETQQRKKAEEYEKRRAAEEREKFERRKARSIRQRR